MICKHNPRVVVARSGEVSPLQGRNDHRNWDGMYLVQSGFIRLITDFFFFFFLGGGGGYGIHLHHSDVSRWFQHQGNSKQPIDPLVLVPLNKDWHVLVSVCSEESVTN